MSKTTTVVTMTPKEAAKSHVAKLQGEKAENEREQAKTQDEATRLYQCFKSSGANSDLEASMRARLRAERARDVLADTIERLRAAEETVRAHVRAEEGESLAAKAKTLRAFDSTRIEPKIASVLALEEQLSNLLLAIAIDVAEGKDLYVHACDQARSLGEPVADIPEPDLKEIRLTIQRRLAEQRQLQARPDQSEWIKSAESFGDWRTSKLNARELEQHNAGVAYARKDEERMRQQALAAEVARLAREPREKEES